MNYGEVNLFYARVYIIHTHRITHAYYFSLAHADFPKCRPLASPSVHLYLIPQRMSVREFGLGIFERAEAKFVIFQCQPRYNNNNNNNL